MARKGRVDLLNLTRILYALAISKIFYSLRRLKLAGAWRCSIPHEATSRPSRGVTVWWQHPSPTTLPCTPELPMTRNTSSSASRRARGRKARIIRLALTLNPASPEKRPRNRAGAVSVSVPANLYPHPWNCPRILNDAPRRAALAQLRLKAFFPVTKRGSCRGAGHTWFSGNNKRWGKSPARRTT